MLTAIRRSFATMSAHTKSAVILQSPTKPSSGTLIFLHGLGDSADGGWADVMQYDIQKKLPKLKVILPNAPVQAVSLNGGMRMQSWHDIKSLNNILKEDFSGVESSRSTVEAIINDEIASGTPSEKIILGGFSQGAAMSLFTGLQFSKPLGGILALSGYLPHSKGDFHTLISDANRATPLLQCHGEVDEVVRFQFGQASFKTIETARKENMTFKSYKNVGHHSSDAEMRDVTQWIETILGKQ